jgi:ParB family chromosome partitioning protein
VRSATTESLSLNNMPEGGQNLCRLADIHSKSLLLQIVRQGDPQKMVALIEKSGTVPLPTKPRKETAKPSLENPKAYVISYKPPRRPSSCSCAFTKSRVDREEVIAALQETIKELRAQ